MKRKSGNRSRQYRIELTLNEDELELLDKLKTLSGHRNRCAVLRNLIAYGCVYNVEYKYLQDYTYELNQIGRRINQIAKRVLVTGNIYEADINQLKEEMEKVWHTHASTLSKAPLISR